MTDLPEISGAHAQGYAEAAARLRDDARYRDWWTSGGVKPDAPIRRHLADYLETVGPDGIDVTTGRWPAREQAVVRAAIAWRKAVDDLDADEAVTENALIEAVDALKALPVADGAEVEPAENRVEYGAVHGTCEHWGSWPTAQSLISWLSEHHPDWRPLIRVTSGAGLEQLRPAPVAANPTIDEALCICPPDGMCSCESYDCQGECCGPGQCSCTPADDDVPSEVVERHPVVSDSIEGEDSDG